MSQAQTLLPRKDTVYPPLFVSCTGIQRRQRLCESPKPLIAADTVCLINEGKTLLIIQQQRTRQGPNEELTKHTLTVVDCAHVVAVEFPDTTPLAGLGITAPAIRTGSHSGTMQRPVYS